nr:dnaJ homolog subfamily C member 21-like [Aegilops tauschii subsp. strangulata]
MLVERVVQLINQGVTGMDLLEVYTEMYSMPNGEQAREQDHEDEDSAEESGEWESPDDDDDDESDESYDKEPTEKIVKLPKINPSKARKTLPKIKMDVPVASGPASAATDMDIDKVPDDEETDDAATSKATPRDVVMLPDDDEEEVPLRERRRRNKGSSGKAPEVQMKVVHEASQVAYNASAALETNVQKDLDLDAAQKEAREKTALANKKLASVSKLEEENSKRKTAVSDANREVEQLKKDKDRLTDEIGNLKAKKGELESYLGQLTAKLVLKLEGL